MTDNQRQFRKELQAVGASDDELRELIPLAASLSVLKNTAESEEAPGEKRSVRPTLFKPLAYTTLGVALGTFLLIMSQSALPTSWLFPIQKASDNIAMHIHPAYRASVMMKRAYQVNQLVVNRADPTEVLATLADYTSVAGAYKSTPHTNYAAFEYCESNLKQASASAAPDVRRAIAASLRILEPS